MKDDRLYLTNIRDCIDRIETYLTSSKLFPYVTHYPTVN
ncbi:hypothetical protein CKA32_005062 [Geitlerinema sp. FC II]|nr:hypothetical protein CKA32_005062 [Geitlerinema sp. FC II]